MTVPSTSQQAGPFFGNGVTTSFPFTFKCFDRAHLKWVTVTSGVETERVLDSDYSVTLNVDQDANPGGTVTYPLTGSPMPSTTSAVLLGNVPLGQVTDLPDGGAFRAATVEQALDVLALQNLQQQDQINRAVRLPVTAPAGASGVLPSPTSDTVLGWGPDGLTLINRTLADVATTATYSSWRTDVFNGNGSTTAFTLTADPGNQNNCDVTIGGVAQIAGVNFTTVGTLLTFTVAPPAGAVIAVRYGQALPVGVVDLNSISFSQPGGVTRSTLTKLREVELHIKDRGGVEDGVTDDSGALQLAINQLGAAGGRVRISGRVRIASDVTVIHNVSIVGQVEHVGSPNNNFSANYGELGSTLIVASGATIRLKGSAGIKGCLIHRAGMTFPAADSSLFAGTAVTVEGDDAFVYDSMILGFNLAMSSTGWQRPRMNNVSIDCVNGIDVDNCADISYITQVHCWPYATIAALGPATSLQRSGTAFRFRTLGDWNKLTNCFAYGYYRGYWNTSCNSMTYLSCSADSTTGFAGQIGFIADGGSTDTRYVATQSAAQETGYYVSTAAGVHTRFIGADSWFCANHGILVDAGDVTVLGGIQRNTANGVSISNASSRVFVDGVRFADISGRPINVTVTTTLVRVGENDYGNYSGAVATSNLSCPTVASAAAIALPPAYFDFLITGTTGIGTINGGWAGRVVTLYFAASVSVFHSTGSTSAVRLNGGVTFAAVAGSTLTLRHNGAQWYEIGRCA